jgi:thioredoxin 1
MVTQINDHKLEERILEAVTPVCITFFAYASNPCKNLMRQLETVEEQFKEKMEFYKINIVENPKITDEMKVEAVPTMIIYRDGSEIARYDGVHNSKALVKQFTADLNKKK